MTETPKTDEPSLELIARAQHLLAEAPVEFHALKAFEADINGRPSHYEPGLRYTLRPGNITLACLLMFWLDDGRVELTGERAPLTTGAGQVKVKGVGTVSD